MRVLRIAMGIALTVAGGLLMIKAGGPSRATVQYYTGPPADMRFQFAGLALIIIGPALIVGRERRRRRITDQLHK